MAVNISLIKLNAPAQKVWDALTQPALVKQWQYGSVLTTDWKIGGPIRFTAEWQGKVFEQWGKVLDYVPHKLISYSLFAPRPDLEDRPENYFVMRYLLMPEDGGIKLEIVQEDNRPGAKQEPPQGEENPVLAALKKLVES
jgi:uncharacterized protein YndB with AHSA1/START domain